MPGLKSSWSIRRSGHLGRRPRFRLLQFQVLRSLNRLPSLEGKAGQKFRYFNYPVLGFCASTVAIFPAIDSAMVGTRATAGRRTDPTIVTYCAKTVAAGVGLRGGPERDHAGQENHKKTLTVTRVRGDDSELRELWQESDEFPAWIAELDRISAALR